MKQELQNVFVGLFFSKLCQFVLNVFIRKLKPET
jgi:hypothetical protein